MSLTTTENRKDFVGDGVTVAFPFPFLFPADDDLDVFIFDTILKTTTLQTIVTDYTVAGAGKDAGGTVTMVTAPADITEELIIIRSVDITQGSNYEDFNRLPSVTLEANLDRLTMICQQLQEQLDRAVVQDVSQTTILTFPPPDAGKVLEWNLAEDGLINSSISISAIQASTDAAAASAAAALVSENNASTSESNAATSATEADTSAAALIGVHTHRISAQCQISGQQDQGTVFSKTEVSGIRGTGNYDFSDGDKTWDINNSGVLGLDTGAAANSTRYYVVGIFDSTAANVPSAIITLESTYTLNYSEPNGYDDHRVLTSFKTDADFATNGIRPVVVQQNDRMWFTSFHETIAVTTSPSTIDISSSIPLIASEITAAMAPSVSQTIIYRHSLDAGSENESFVSADQITLTVPVDEAGLIILHVSSGTATTEIRGCDFNVRNIT